MILCAAHILPVTNFFNNCKRRIKCDRKSYIFYINLINIGVYGVGRKSTGFNLSRALFNKNKGTKRMKKTFLTVIGAVALFLSLPANSATLCSKHSMTGVWAYQDDEAAGWLTITTTGYKLIARDLDYIFETNETGTATRIGDCTFELTADKNNSEKSNDTGHDEHLKKRLVYLSSIDFVTKRASFGSLVGGTISRRMK